MVVDHRLLTLVVGARRETKRKSQLTVEREGERGSEDSHCELFLEVFGDDVSLEFLLGRKKTRESGAEARRKG